MDSHESKGQGDELRKPQAGMRGVRVLLIEDGVASPQLLRQELQLLGCEVLGTVDNAALIHDCVQRLQPDVVIVNAESPTRDTLENLAALNDALPRPVVVFAEDPADAPMRRALQAGVSAYVVAGLQPQRLAPVLQVAIARFEQDLALRQELDRAQAQLAARKTIERAKGILMQEAGLDEEAAYQRLRKLAMDRKLPMAELAARIIEAQSLLRPT
ncbi:ANTAR domain-containing protein [Mitsuaria sp. WAJ17]|uniref:ANTAR domain-containing response regulator n=1 Tax=Mitsuaria sp. WAJ17 TaxID=2761452 RepID=UPI001601E3F9|nr:ANTAR domain-containing protein [Mitsuaria sp. WAJ17]MBB2485913.1 ANTAR domain-containing protein [Mitsuaria sp. WAJ17]